MRSWTLGGGATLTVIASAVIAFAPGQPGATALATERCDPGVETAPGNPPLSPNADDLVVGHRVVLTGAAGPKVHEFRDRPGGWWWLKTLVVVRRGRAVTLTVPPGERNRLRLRYKGNPRTATFRPCPRAAKWSYYPGGFVYAERGCYALDIRIEGQRKVRRHIPLGVGAGCGS